MSNERDGGPAFPTHKDAAIGYTDHSPGMSLRDWFAGQIFPAVLISTANAMNNGTLDKDVDQDAIARCSYKCADALLKAREARS